ncbi:MAG: acyl-CoA mutase large subunit family protein, partial [Solirubrobacteraceae bacterium]
MAIEKDESVAPVVGPDDPRRFTDSGIEVAALYDAADLPADLDLGEPGEFPFTRGIHREMYRKRLWTMRQYAGYASAKESNERYKYLLAQGSTGLSMAFDLPTQLGLDSDDPRCLGEVGRTGVAIDTIDDMRTAFDGIPLDHVSVSMTINAPAGVLLLLYELVAEEQGIAAEQLQGTVQNDILKEYIARGNFIYPPEPSMRLTIDLFAYCHEKIPHWTTVSISGYHFREKGSSAVQEVAFTLASGIAYVQAALDAGLKVDDFAPRLAFFFNGHNNVFQEVAKFRAARNMWAHAMKERFGAQDKRSTMLRFHTQTGGVTLTAQQPQNNVVRVALQAFAAVCGGTQSLHTNGFDEALALPTEHAAKVALRTQQIVAHESGATDTADPFAGSYYVESLTAEIERRAWKLIERIDEMGGSVNAIAFIKGEIEDSAFGYHERYRTGQDVVVGVNRYVDEELGGSVNALEFIQREIEASALSYHERYRSGQDIVVGVNKYVTDTVDDVDILKVDPEAERRQKERLAKFKANRDQDAVTAKLEAL